MTPQDPPDDALLVQLYSCFSEHTYCAGWMMDPWHPHIKREFTDWLRRYLVQPVSEPHLKDYEITALETLRECWADAQVDATSPDGENDEANADLPVQARENRTA